MEVPGHLYLFISTIICIFVLMVKRITKICRNCNQSFDADRKEHSRGNAHYCSLSCVAKYPKEHKHNKICKQCARDFTSVSNNASFCSNICKQRNYRQRSKHDSFSIKTLYKLLDNSACQICSWNETTCDIHHILPVSKGGKNVVENLIVLCPNHHRLADRNLISQDELLSLIKDRTISSSYGL